MLKKRVGERKFEPVSILKKDLLEFDKKVHKIEALFKNICIMFDISAATILKEKLTEAEFKKADV